MGWSKGDKVVELRQGRRRELVLGESLAFGGAGEVFGVEGSGSVCVKLMDAPTASRQGKICELLAKHEQGRVRDSDATWPRGLVVSGPDDAVVGYTMDRVRGRSLSEVAADPSADFAQRTRCALSLCQVVSRLHGTQHTSVEDRMVVGDLDLANAMLDSRTGQVKLIDTDGMQVVSTAGGRRLAYPTSELRTCSPETVGKRTGTYLLTSRHDWFLVAICVSRLLMPGDPLYREPAPGTDPREDRERVVGERLYPYEEHCAEWGLPAPRQVMGAELADLLRQSLTAPWDQIPSTTVYAEALGRLATKGVRTCPTCGGTWSAGALEACPYCSATHPFGTTASWATTRVLAAPAAAGGVVPATAAATRVVPATAAATRLRPATAAAGGVVPAPVAATRVRPVPATATRLRPAPVTAPRAATPPAQGLGGAAAAVAATGDKDANAAKAADRRRLVDLVALVALIACVALLAVCAVWVRGRIW